MASRRLPSVLALLACLLVTPGQGAEPTANAAGAAGPAPAIAVALPQFRPGLWEYRRTRINSGGDKPQTATVRKCSDPTAEFKRKLAELQGRGCVFEPLKQDGRHYEASWRCSAPDGTVLAMRDSITVLSDTSYQNESEAFVSHEATHSTIVAIRIGACSEASRRNPRVTAPSNRPPQ
jgi:uncharacterized protein DUF3617